MAKITIPAAKTETTGLKISVSAANPYLSADGQIDVGAFAKLANRIKVANGKVPTETTTTGREKPVKLASTILYSGKPIAKYSASLEKKNDHKYKVARGQQIKSRTKMPAAESRVKFVMLLPAAIVGVDKTILAEIKKATSAASSHNKKALRIVDKVKVEKGKARDAANAEFDKNVDAVKAILLAGGIKEANIVVGQSMFGKIVHVKLPNGGVVSIGKSDDAKLRAAKKMNQAASK